MTSNLFSEEDINNLRQLCTLPCSINGDGYSKCFENVEFNKFDIKKNNEFNYYSVCSGQNFCSSNNFNLDSHFELDFLSSKNKFNIQVENYLQNNSIQRYYVGKYILFTINIRVDDNIFTKNYRSQFKNISKFDLKEQLYELEKIFDSTGYYAPCQIQIGGKFISKIDYSKIKKEGNFNLESSADFSSKDFNFNSGFEVNKEKEREINNYFFSKKEIIQGGDTDEKNIDKWKKSINIKNAVIIGYADFKPLESLIPLTIRNDLRDAIKLLDGKIKARKEYLGIIENLSKVDKPAENVYKEKIFNKVYVKNKNIQKLHVIYMNVKVMENLSKE